MARTLPALLAALAACTPLKPGTDRFDPCVGCRAEQLCCAGLCLDVGAADCYACGVACSAELPVCSPTRRACACTRASCAAIGQLCDEGTGACTACPVRTSSVALVDPTAEFDGNGTAECPFLQISSAIPVVGAGELVRLRAGVYAGREFPIIIDRPVHLVGEGDVVIRGEGSYVSGSARIVMFAVRRGAGVVTLERLRFRGSDERATAVYLDGQRGGLAPPSSLRVRDVHFGPGVWVGIEAVPTSEAEVEVDRSVFEGGSYGIAFEGRALTIRDSELFAMAYGIDSSAHDPDADVSLSIERCRFLDLVGYGVSVRGRVTLARLVDSEFARITNFDGAGAGIRLHVPELWVPEVRDVRRNRFVANDGAIAFEGSALPQVEPARFDFGTAASPGENQFVCNSAEVTNLLPPSGDVRLDLDFPTATVALAGNRWDRVPVETSTRNGAELRIGHPGSPHLELAGARTHGEPCPDDRAR